MIAALALALVAGLLIGCIGIGGVLLVPGLTLVGVEVHRAIAASMFSYMFSGLIAAWLFARQGSILWAQALWLGIGAMPGALAGALIASRLEGEILLGLVGAAVILGGLRTLRRPVAGAAPAPAAPWLLLLGAGIGVASAVTGTGGPLLLVPVLLALGMPVIGAVGLGQAIQIPIAGLASLGNLALGRLDLGLGLLLALGGSLGAMVGARLAHAAPTERLTRFVAVVLLLVGALLVFRSGEGLFLGAAH